VANGQEIAQQAAELGLQHQHIERHEEQIAADDLRIVATRGIAEANGARIANLDDYDIIGTVTVYFDNGQAMVHASYRESLQRLIDQARDLNGYVFQVQGYASQVGSDALNERLSAERAQAVARVLVQGGVPPTNLAVPAAMGTSLQVAPNASEKGQAENRRAVVTLMQNKGIARR
jgi:outer membrane protein OmpA-like peptidoglycan-associated protein